MAAKANDTELAARVNEVYRLLLGGANRQDVLDIAVKLGWNVSDRQVDTYIKRAKAALAKESRFRRASEFGKALNRLNNLYSKAVRISDYRTALAVQREINTLLSLYLPEAPKTLQLLDIDERQFAQLAELLHQNGGKKPSDLFAALIAELAANDTERTE